MTYAILALPAAMDASSGLLEQHGPFPVGFPLITCYSLYEPLGGGKLLLLPCDLQKHTVQK